MFRGASTDGFDSTDSCTWWMSKLEAVGEIGATEADFGEFFSRAMA